MAYGLIQVDKVENSDGKSLNVGPGARVFDTVTELQASTTLSDGDIVTVKERANAEYKIQPSTYTALDGDLTLTSGQVAELQLKPVNDVRWFGVVGDGSDEYDLLRGAISREIVIDLMGLTVGVGQSIWFRYSSTLQNGTLQAVDYDYWSANTADVDSLTKGLALINARALGGSSDNEVEIHLKSLVIDCGLTTLDSENEDVAAAGICGDLYGSLTVTDVIVNHYIGYGFWHYDKSTIRIDDFEARQWLWGESGWYDSSLRTAYGIVNGYGDGHYNRIVSSYNKSNIHIIDGAFNTFWVDVHPVAGDDAASSLPNITIEGGYHQFFTNLYLDNGYIEISSDDKRHQFFNLMAVNTTASSNRTVFKMISNQTDDDLSGFIVSGLSTSWEVLSLEGTGTGNFVDEKKLKHILTGVNVTETSTDAPIAPGVVNRYQGNIDLYSSEVPDDMSVGINGLTGLLGVFGTSLSLANFASFVDSGTNGTLFNVAYGSGGYDLLDSNDSISTTKYWAPDGSDFTLNAVTTKAIASSSSSSTVQGGYDIGLGDGTSTTTEVTYRFRSTSLYCTDEVSLGISGNRWSQVYATNGTINTSDARLKTDLVELTDYEVNAAVAISKAMGYTWQWLENGDRTHTGPTVQLIMGIMEDNNLDPFDYSFICYDEWDEQTEKVEVTPAVLDDDGNVVTKAVYEDQVIVEAGNRYSFRENELIKFCNAGLSARLDSQQDTIDSILSRLDSLEG